jgi:hypothetical protein
MEKLLKTKKERTLYVIQITKEELAKNWEMELPKSWKNPLFIRCTKEGKFSWESSPIYHQEQIKARKLVTYITREN